MKIEYTEGCLCYGLDVDGEPFNNLDHDKKIAVFDRIFEHLDEEYGLYTMLVDILQHYGEYKHIGHCDECGDNISSFTLEI